MSVKRYEIHATIFADQLPWIARRIINDPTFDHHEWFLWQANALAKLAAMIREGYAAEKTDIVDLCHTVADGAASAWDDAPDAFQPILLAASEALSKAATEIERLQTELHDARGLLGTVEDAADTNGLAMGLHPAWLEAVKKLTAD